MSQGTVTFNPPSPGSIVATAGSVTCTATGNAAPATAVSIQCTLGTVQIPAYTIPLPANSAYTFDHRLNNDAITMILQSDASGKLTWQASATPNGGTTQSGNGTL